MAEDIKPLPDAEHAAVLREKVLGARSYTDVVGGHTRPTAIILSGQPGSGKGSLTAAAKAEFNGNIAVVDPDTLRDAHPSAGVLRRNHPYTWADHTHPDASQWAKELRADAIAQRKHLVIDSTMPKAELIRELQAKGYQVEVRAVAAHRFESELGVDHRFGKGIDETGYGRYVPEHLRNDVYKQLPATLDDVARQTGVPVQIYDREGRLHFDSRTAPNASPGRALESARLGRLTQDRLNDLHASTDAQRQWHRDLPDRVPNQRVSPDTARHLLDERQTGRVEEGVKRLHNEVGGYRAVRPTVKAAGVLGTAYGVVDAKDQVDAAIDTARSNREQWVRGGEETANQTVKTAVTGGAATVGAIPGAAVGTLTSPVTGPVGPVVGGLATGGAAAVGAEKLYEDSRLQQWSKTLGREVGQLGYDYVSKEGRLLRQVNGLREDLQHTTDPAERARLQTRLDTASAAFGKEAERNGRYFEGRAGIDKGWEAMHARFPKVDKDDVNDALARHIDASKKPADAVRGAYSDAVHEKYPRALPHEPLENYRALSKEQLAQKHQQFAGEVAQGRRTVEALQANKDSHNNVDQGWPRALAQQRQAGRVQQGANELWRDIGHLGAIRGAYKERGLPPPELPAELKPRAPQASPVRPCQTSHTSEQQRHHALAREQLAPGLRARGLDDERIDRVSAAAVNHAQAHANRGEVRAFHLSKDGERIAMVQAGAPVSEFSVREAQTKPAEQHLAQAQQTAQVQAQDTARTAAAPAAPAHTAPERAMA
ncbi:zeta toxin family protein [Hydrogenophaga flava]|uniref:zeta toxin family protein n=1 Tax=Hydrogenophaga flava TaxID=65657 RepID=UPI000824DDFA|nr:zeta toxin family protein [Hydrogenophaga flava]